LFISYKNNVPKGDRLEDFKMASYVINAQRDNTGLCTALPSIGLKTVSVLYSSVHFLLQI
jgi:hypothetical protein